MECAILLVGIVCKVLWWRCGQTKWCKHFHWLKLLSDWERLLVLPLDHCYLPLEDSRCPSWLLVVLVSLELYYFIWLGQVFKIISLLKHGLNNFETFWNNFNFRYYENWTNNSESTEDILQQIMESNEIKLKILKYKINYLITYFGFKSEVMFCAFLDNTISFSTLSFLESMLEPQLRGVGASEYQTGSTFLLMSLVYMIVTPLCGFVSKVESWL